MAGKIKFTKKMAEGLCGASSGSGLDTKPVIVTSRRNVTVHWDFHLLSQYGYYMGYWSFKLVIPVSDPMGFKLRGKRGNTRCREAYDIRDYLDELFGSSMETVLRESGIRAEWRQGLQKYVYSYEVKQGETL